MAMWAAARRRQARPFPPISRPIGQGFFRMAGCWCPISRSWAWNSQVLPCPAASPGGISLLGEIHDDGNVVGRRRPSARRLQDARILDRAREFRRYPDVVKAPAAVGGLPIEGTIAPPAIEPFAGRNDLAHRIDPFG